MPKKANRKSAFAAAAEFHLLKTLLHFLQALPYAWNRIFCRLTIDAVNYLQTRFVDRLLVNDGGFRRLQLMIDAGAAIRAGW